ncbi:MAG TPA: protein kinase [Terriglobales bacterium]|nr:protein kinase [Terriglobales bacterium]
MIGQQLGHYRIEAQIGAGGMGVVYRAQDESLGRAVALKLVSERFMADRKARKRLIDEARNASALNHPNICTIFEVGEADGHTYIAMEHVEGRTLNGIVLGQGLPPETLLRYAVQIADALAHAHQRGVIHRDLKSANVMITTEGRAKVLDFGLATREREQEIEDATRSRMSLTEAKTVAGTLHYMPPEVLRGQPADERSDIWSLGVMLYEMAAGRLPFSGATTYELSSAILREPIPALPANAGSGLRAVVGRCLKREPGERYQKASEVRAALETLESSTEVTVPVPAAGETQRVSRWVIVGGAVLIAAVIIAIGIRGTPFGIGITSSEGRESPARQPVMQLEFEGKPSANAEANEYFQKGVLFLNTQFNVPRAREMFERALEIDPRFGKARGVYAFTYVLMIEGGYSNDSALLYKAEAEARRALQDDPSSRQSRIALAGVYLLQGRKELVSGELEQVSKGDPNSGLPATMWELLYHRFNGNYGRAEQLANEMLAATPTFFPARTYRGEMWREQGKPADDIREQEKVLEQDATNILALGHLSRAYLDLGDVAKARATLERVKPEDRRNYRIRLARALVLAREGKRVEALKEMDSEVQKYAGSSAPLNVQAAAFYATLGEKEKALEWLDRAVRNGDERAEYFQSDPLLRSIRDEARFKQVLESIAYRRQQRTPGM